MCVEWELREKRVCINDAGEKGGDERVSKIAEIKTRIDSFKELETKLMSAGPGLAAKITTSQSLIEEHYYADVSDLLDMVGTALYELEKLEPLLEMPTKGYVRNGFNSVLRTLKGDFIG